MNDYIKTLLAPFILLACFSLQGQAEDGEIILKAERADTPRTVQPMRAAPARAVPNRMESKREVRKMMRELKPRTRAMPAASGANSLAKGTNQTPKYEITDCTGSDGKPKVCCSFQPGGGGSTCDVFMALCDSHDGWSSTGNSNGATCSGDGVIE